MGVEIRLIEKEELGSKAFQKDAKYKPYLEYLLGNKASTLCKNIDADFKVLQVGNHLLPLCVTNGELHNSFSCSVAGSIRCHQDKLKKTEAFKKSFIIPFLSFAIFLVQLMNVDKAVIVDHWLFLVNSYPQLSQRDWSKVTEFLIQTFPDHVISFNSLNDYINQALIQDLKDIGYQAAPWKQAVVVDPTKEFKITNSAKNDFRLMNQSDFTVTADFTEIDYPRIVELYNMLFLEKYTSSSAQITEEFVRLCYEHSILDFIGLRNQEGMVEGIMGLFTKSGIMHDPILGYNLDLPKEKGVYRILKAIELRHAIDNKLIHYSGSGATHFKQLRGGVLTTDYIACFYQHLPLKKRAFYDCFKKACRAFITI